MTGYQSKKAAAQDKLDDDDIQDYKKPWVDLTDEEVDQFHNWKDCTWSTNELVRHVEAKLREKNS